jgi:iron-sulfur cluster repair protein YtfE (RIC family)
MASADNDQETELGRALFEELLWVHGMVRHDLDVVTRLADDTAAGSPPDALKAEILDLKTNGHLWRLKLGCLRYCRFVHSHHNLEDVALFPVLRGNNPALGTVVDKLEHDHKRVSHLLDGVEAAANSLTINDEQSTRKRLSGALTKLAEELLAHLEFEERNAGPTIRRLHAFP